MKSKFDFNEIVKIISDKPSLKSIKGKNGVVVGKSQNETNPEKFGYAVSIMDELTRMEECWSIAEEDIETTGQKSTPNKSSSGEVMKIRMDPKSGRGKIIDDENNK